MWDFIEKLSGYVIGFVVMLIWELSKGKED